MAPEIEIDLQGNRYYMKEIVLVERYWIQQQTLMMLLKYEPNDIFGKFSRVIFITTATPPMSETNSLPKVNIDVTMANIYDNVALNPVLRYISSSTGVTLWEKQVFTLPWYYIIVLVPYLDKYKIIFAFVVSDCSNSAMVQFMHYMDTLIFWMTWTLLNVAKLSPSPNPS